MSRYNVVVIQDTQQEMYTTTEDGYNVLHEFIPWRRIKP